MDDPGFYAVQTNEAEPTHNLRRREQRCETFLVSKTILECENGSPGIDQWRKQPAELIVRRTLQPNDNQIRRTNLFRRAGAFRLDPKISLGALDENTFAADYFVIRAQQKVHLLACPSQFGAVETADRSATNNGNFQESREENRVAMPWFYPL
jgi:hypothetical protein